MQAVREVLQKSGIPSETADIVLSAWRSGTSKECNSCVKRWVLYCQQRGQVPLQPTVIAVLQFLTLLFEEGKGYSSLKIARCAISTLSLGEDTLGSHHLIGKYLRGVFNRRPALPRNNVTWDADMVLNFLKTWAPAKRLSHRQLTLKVRVLLLLLSGQLGHTIWLLDTRNIMLSENEVRWRIGDLIKTSNSKNYVDELVLFCSLPSWSEVVCGNVRQSLLKWNCSSSEKGNWIFDQF